MSEATIDAPVTETPTETAPAPAKPAPKAGPRLHKPKAAAKKPTAKPARAVRQVTHSRPATKAKASANGKPAARDKRLPNPGSVIKREYKGKEYKVKVRADSFEFNGKEYGSLSAVAKALRKSPMEVNGFAFFGLA